MTDRPDYCELQKRLGRDNKTMGEALGLSSAMWSNIRSGRRWVDDVPPERVDALNALLAEAGLATFKTNGAAFKGNGADHADDVDAEVSGEVHVEDENDEPPQTGPKPPHLELIDRLQQMQGDGQDITTAWRSLLVRAYGDMAPEQVELVIAAVRKQTGITVKTLRDALQKEREAYAAEQYAAMQREAEANRPPPVDEEEQRETKRTTLAQGCAEILGSPDVMGLVEQTMAALGVVGEQRIVRMVFLCVTSRLFEKIASLKVHGPSSSGKSYTTETTLKLFPEDAVVVLSAGSERSLIYSDKDFRHRFVVLLEATPLQKNDADDMFSYIVRSLLSEGRIVYETVVAGGEGGQPHGITIIKEGPTGLLVTTTATKLHAENETRLLSVVTDDSEEQTRRVLMTIAAGEDRQAVSLGAWHDFQRWLELGPKQVSIPYAHILAGLVDVQMVRMRRDFSALLALIRAHAVIHQTHRDRDDRGRIVANVDDYAGTRDLVESMVAFEVGADVSPEVRRLVEEVMKLVEEEYFNQAKERQLKERSDSDRYESRTRYDDAETGDYIPEPTMADLRKIKVEISQRRLGKLMGREQSSVQRWVVDAIDLGYLLNHHAGFKGKPMLLSLDDDLPGIGRSVLPTVQQLREALTDL